MYHLEVYDPGARAPRAMVSVASANDVLAMIPKLLADHDGCERVVVLMLGTRLFSIDCAGNREP